MTHDEHTPPMSHNAGPQEGLLALDASAMEMDSLGYEGAFPYLSALEADLETC